MPIYDFTNEFKSPNVDWSRGGRKFLNQFNDHIQQTTRGVYILFAANDSDVDIVDRNKHQKPGGRVNVPARGMVVKFGKYESGIALRERTNYQHWHRRPNGVEEAGIFPSCIAMLLVGTPSMAPSAGRSGTYSDAGGSRGKHFARRGPAAVRDHLSLLESACLKESP